MRALLSHPSHSQPAAQPGLPRSPQRAFPNASVRWALCAFVASIPFEMPHRAIPVEIPTLVGCVFLLVTLFDRRSAYGRIPAPLIWFTLYLWVFAVAALVNRATHQLEVLRLFLEMLLLLLLFWTAANLMRDDATRRSALRVFAIACGLRAGLQLLGIATTAREVWTGGARVTALGQNANLSALILSAGLLAALELGGSREGSRRWPAAVRWSLVVLIAVAIVQTGSRGGLLALAVGLLTFLARAPTPWARLRNAMAAVALMAFLGVAAYRSEVMRNRLEEAATTGNFAQRERIYPALLVMFRERPFLGWGPIENQFELERRLREPGREHRDAHNLVLELLTTTGVVGIMPFLAGLVLCVRSAWRARRTARGVLPLAMVASMLVGVMSGTWIASKILWFTLAHAFAAQPQPAPGTTESGAA